MAQNNADLATSIDEILQTLDPLGLIAIGCPRDEYWGEVQFIVDALKTSSSTHNLASKIKEIFQCQFGSSFTHDVPNDDWMQMAEQIWTASVNYRDQGQ